MAAPPVKYYLDSQNRFVVENYNWAKPFSNFFPGIAGKWGIPMWVYYVSKAQAICSVGVHDKDHAILEFMSFNKALQDYLKEQHEASGCDDANCRHGQELDDKQLKRNFKPVGDLVVPPPGSGQQSGEAAAKQGPSTEPNNVYLAPEASELQDLQVTVGVRFIQLRDNFFEQVGVGFQDQQVAGDTGDPLQRRLRALHVIENPQKKHDIEGPHPLRRQIEHFDLAVFNPRAQRASRQVEALLCPPSPSTPAE